MTTFRKVLLCFALLLLLLPKNVFAEAISPELKEAVAKEWEYLQMYFTEEELTSVSSTRSLKPLSRIADNIEIVTAHDIELMNAHTLADVLNTVNGVEVNFSGTSPGSIAAVKIQGSDVPHVVVFIDGVSNTFLSSDWNELEAVPAPIIDKIEIVKGPASSAWGSSLGGIINVITKSPNQIGGVGGTLSASYGERNTSDIRAEINGRDKGFGYYLYAGSLNTDGLRPYEKIYQNNLYAKMTYEIGTKTDLGLTLLYNFGDREEGDFSSRDLYLWDKNERLQATAYLTSKLSSDMDLSLLLKTSRRKYDVGYDTLSTGESIYFGREFNIDHGAGGRITWTPNNHTVVVGVDYDYKELKGTDYEDLVTRMNVFGVYANDTIVIDKFSITPGFRYDHTDRGLDFASPSLGVTYSLGKKSLLRAIVSRGFHMPPLAAYVDGTEFYTHASNLEPEKVWSYQAGFETGLLEYAWLKLTLFRHNITDAIVTEFLDDGTWTFANSDKVRRQGYELEIRSKKIGDFTFNAATAVTYIKNLTADDDGSSDAPQYTIDMGVKYDDEKSLRGLVSAKYHWFHQIPYSYYHGKYTAFVVDANIIKTLMKEKNRAWELFLTGHNLFNGAQYWTDYYMNARRWVEAGLRYKF